VFFGYNQGHERTWSGALLEPGGFYILDWTGNFGSGVGPCAQLTVAGLYPWAVQGQEGQNCLELGVQNPSSKVVGVVAPLTATSGTTSLVFHDWEVVDPQPGRCRTGNMGIRAIPDDPSYRGGNTPFAEGVEQRLIGANGSGELAKFRAVYAPKVPDISPPLISVASPRDCMAIPIGAIAPVNFSCRDLGSGVSSCTASPGYANDAAINTSAYGNFSFTVTATDADNNTRTRTVRYSVVDATHPRPHRHSLRPPTPMGGTTATSP